jgi:lipopolysaccharide export system permease protein
VIARLMRPLDRYVFREFWKIFLVTSIGFPILVIVFDLTDNLERYLTKRVPRVDIALSYLYWLPDSMFMILPAAVLFATVFVVGNFTRHSEITAAKASGISFHRLIRPILLGALFAAALDLGLGEVVPITNAKRADLLGEARYRADSVRWNFAHASDHGRVYKAGMLDRVKGEIRELQIERKGNGPDYPTYVITAREAAWRPGAGWALQNGAMHVVPDTGRDVAFSFQRMIDRKPTERPADLMAKPRSPQEMRYTELTRFIVALERSGGDANVLRVERALKIAIPVTCFIIALFGAPLATSTQRGGTPYGIGISLATTIVFLMMIQLTKAIGGKGLIDPDLAAWIPNAVFAVVGVFLLARART